MKIYLDTSVPSACLDASHPERQEATTTFWRLLRSHSPHVSTLVIEEMELTPDRLRRRRLLALVSGWPRLRVNLSAVRELADGYLELAALPPRAEADAIHVATATVHGISLVVSWNLRDMVNVQTRARVNAVNALHGYPAIELVTPPMLGWR